MKVCPSCKKEHSKRGDFCSRECFLAGSRISKTCESCGQTFIVLKCYSFRRYCGRKCFSRVSRKNYKLHTTVKCSNCGENKDVVIEDLTTKKNHFCNKQCYQEFHSKNSEYHSCHICGQKTNNDEFCSRECYRIAFEPENFSEDVIGKFYITRDGRKIHYNSSLELLRMKELDFSLNVKKWERCKDKIEWIDELKKKHVYQPDFMIIEADGTKVVEEIKGYHDLRSKMKIDAARAYYTHLGIRYRVLFADDFKNNLEVHLETYQNEHGFFSRPSLYFVWMSLALNLEQRSTCIRNKVGAVFTDDKMHQALCLGYNGNYSDGPNQCDSLQPGGCGCAHAEVNAISKSTQSLQNSTLFVTVAPCYSCSKLLLNRGIKRVIYQRSYRDVSGIVLLRKNGVEVFMYDDFIENRLDISYDEGEENDISDFTEAQGSSDKKALD